MRRAPRYAAILAGGSGTRFWPRSRRRLPKQLLQILGGRSMLQETVDRVASLIPRARVLVVTSREQARGVRAQVPGLAAGNVLSEPEGRNTAAAIALAALRLTSLHPDAVMAVLPADHAIPDRALFRADLDLALSLAERTGALVTIGVKPTHPETGYGYIRPGKTVPGTRGRAAWVQAFVEKPDRARAEALLAEEGILWNAGIFAWRAASILSELRTYVPAVLEPLEAIADAGTARLAATYRRLPAVSIDVGVLERARRVAVVLARFAWGDVGRRAALEPFWGANGAGANAVRGQAVAIDSRGCVVDAPSRLVALLGVNDLVVVDTADAILVCRKDRAQDVRLLVDELRRRRLARYL